MTDTIDDVAAAAGKEPVGPAVDEQGLAEQLVAQAREKGIELVGPDGLLSQLTKRVLETALEAEMSDHRSNITARSGPHPPDPALATVVRPAPLVRRAPVAWGLYHYGPGNTGGETWPVFLPFRRLRRVVSSSSGGALADRHSLGDSQRVIRSSRRRACDRRPSGLGAR